MQKVVAPQDLAAATAKLVGQVCRQSAVTMRAAKVVANMHGRALTGADTDALIRFGVEAYEGADLREGVAAFSQDAHPNLMISAMTDADSAVPPRLDEDAISKLELTEVADLIRTRQLTSAEVTESTLRRIERLDPS